MFCKKCNTTINELNTYKNHKYICKDCFKIKRRQYYQVHKKEECSRKALYQKKNYIKQQKWARRWRKQNLEKLKLWYREYTKINGACYSTIKRRTDPLFKLITNLRVRLNDSLTSKKWNNSTHFREYIGCTKVQLVTHLEKQFQPGMTWQNHGEWHIDHIVPLSSAKTKEELYKLCHFTNLQPLWAEDNIKKSNKLVAS